MEDAAHQHRSPAGLQPNAIPRTDGNTDNLDPFLENMRSFLKGLKLTNPGWYLANQVEIIEYVSGLCGFTQTAPGVPAVATAMSA